MDESPKQDVKEIKSFYDNVYYADAGETGGESLSSHYRGLLTRLRVVPGEMVLDVACGTGGWLQACEGAGAKVSGVDLSSRAIDVCNQRLPNGRFHAQPAETLPFEDGVFDVVTCLGSLEHFVDPLGSLREMRRVAKAGARFLILVPNSDFLTRKLGLFAGTYQVDAREEVRTLEAWKAMFYEAGLEVNQRWKDLHVLNRQWICSGPWYGWPLRGLQAAALPLLPLRWQYQVYHMCRSAREPEPN